MPTVSRQQAFELDPESYDALVDWPRRLAREQGFYRRLLDAVAARRVLDVACGTGRHALLLHSWGLEVEGADILPSMIDFCRARHGQTPTLRWVVRSFTERAAAGQFDAVLCVGNSLATACDLATARQALAAMLAALRPGGVAIVHVLNLARLRPGPVTWQKCRPVRRGGQDHVLLKGVHRAGEQGYVEFVDITLTGGEPAAEFHAAALLPLSAEWLRDAALAAGGRNVQLYGGYGNEPCSATESTDLILVCERG